MITGCEVLCYRIVASNCGSCPAITAHTTVVCTNIPTNSDICTFAIQTIICDGLAGNVSDPIHVLLRGTTMMQLLYVYYVNFILCMHD